jgi:hypothetical protein
MTQPPARTPAGEAGRRPGNTTFSRAAAPCLTQIVLS